MIMEMNYIKFQKNNHLIKDHIKIKYKTHIQIEITIYFKENIAINK